MLDGVMLISAGTAAGKSDPLADWGQSERIELSGSDCENSDCTSKSPTQISLDDLLAIHTYDVDSHVQPNEAVLHSLSRFGKRVHVPPNVAVFGAMPP